MQLLLPLYFGLVPVVLVVGMVQAVMHRHRLGARASNQLVAGGGMLLLLHLSGLVRPLLRNALLDRGLLGPDSFAVLSLLQLLVQATGFGLIIAAAVTRRPDDAAAVEVETEHPAEEHGSRVRTRVWVALAGVAAVVAIAAAGTWIVRSAQANSVPPWRVSEDQQAEQCLNNHTQSAQVKGKPVEAMLLRSNGGWLRVYVSKPDNWIIACQGGPQALMSAFATVMDEGTNETVPGGLQFYGGYDSVLKGHLLLGKLPNGGAFVRAVLPDGRTLQGEHNGDIFVVWEPGVSAEGAQVTVLTQDRAVITTSAAPSEQG